MYIPANVPPVPVAKVTALTFPSNIHKKLHEHGNYAFWIKWNV